MNPSETFVVGCRGISFHQGVVLIDLDGLSATAKDDQGHPVREFSHRILTTPPGLVEMFNAIQGILDKLVQVGVLTRQEGTVAPQPQPQGGQPKSPNF
jgi:hypothetical protein